MKEKLALSLLALIVVASGCVDGTSNEPQGSIHVDYLNFVPQDRQIFTGGTVNIDMKVSNIGEADAALNPGEEGSKILTNYCPYLFNLESFESFGDNSLKPGENLELRWRLQQAGEVLSVGSTCQMEFRLPFNYSGSVYRQIQLKESEDVADTNNLAYESSSGPLMFEVATIAPSGSSPVFTMPEGDRTKTVTVLMRMRNKRPEKGSIDMHEKSLEIEIPELGIDEGFETVTSTEVRKCSTGTAGIIGGERSQAFCISKEEAVKWTSETGETKCDLDELEPLKMYESKSRVISCNVELPSGVSDSVDFESDPSVISEVQASVNYTYTKEMPSRAVKVDSRG